MKRFDGLLSKLKECKDILFPKKERPLDDFSTLELVPVKVFLEDFIGVIITNFTTFNDEIKDLEKDIQAKMVVGIDIKDKDIWIKLSALNGTPGGFLKISPTIFGQFSESSNREKAMVDALYQLTFYGGLVLEYTDFKGKGMISYHSSYLKVDK